MNAQPWRVLVTAAVVVVGIAFLIATVIADDLIGGGTPTRWFWAAVVFVPVATAVLVSLLLQRALLTRVRARAAGPVLLVRPNGELRDLLLHRGRGISLVNGSLRRAPRVLGAVSFEPDGIHVWSLGARDCGLLPWDRLTHVEGTTRREGNRDELAVVMRADGIMGSVVVLDAGTGAALRDPSAIDAALEAVPADLRA